MATTKKKTTKPAAKPAPKSAAFVNIKDLKRLGITLSVLVNAIVLVLLIVGWIDWHNGTVNDLTGGLQTSTCQNFFTKEAKSYIPLRKATTIGNVKFVPGNLTQSEFNSPCQGYMEEETVGALAQANNANATKYFYSLYGRKTVPSNEKINIPLYYNGTTGDLYPAQVLIP